MQIALLSLLGVAIGATLQYLFTRVLEERRHLRDLRTAAYSGYLQCVAEMKHRFIQPQAPGERELLARLTDAKVRLSLYGSPAVVQSLARFERAGGTLKTENEQAAFVGILKTMRGDAAVPTADLEMIILGPSDAAV